MHYDQYFIDDLRSRADLVRSFGLAIVLVLSLAVLGRGQEPLKAILSDEHSEIPCDDTLSRIDSFLAELRENPEDTGLVVLSGAPENKHRIVFRQMVVQRHMKWRQFDLSRIRFLRARSVETTVQFWRIPLGADDPKINEVDMSLTIPKNVKPFLMGYQTKIGDQICPEIDDAEIFASFLKANRSARGNIVIRERSTTHARQKAASILRQFERKYGISAVRLRTFTAVHTYSSDHDEFIVEYWYLP